MDQEIKLLMLEDVPDDAELQLLELRRAGIRVNSVRAQTEEDFRRRLDEFEPDVVLSDFSLPGFDGMSALAIVREKRPDVPFIFVSGTIGEERAIESFKRGATDYVLKTNLSRLAPVVMRALQEAHERAARRRAERERLESEERFRAIVETTQEWIWEIDRQGRCTFNSPFVHALLGYHPEELLGTDSLALMHAEDRAKFESLWSGLKAGKRGWTGLVLRWRHKDGSYRWLESNAIPLLDGDGNVIGYRGADRDVTERIRQQEKITRLSRIQAVLSEINATIVRVRDRRELFRQACRIAVEQGEFRMAWVGLANPGATKVRPVAWMGVEEGYLDEVGLSLSNAGEDEGAAGRALRDKKLVVANDIETDPQIVFKAEALLRGYRSLVALPLLVEGEAIAVMVLYAAQPDVFDDQELKLLDDLAADISFALDYIEKEERLDYLSHHDALTGLPNRTLFHDRLTQFVRSAGLEQRKVAVLMIDLERFRNVNDTLGRHAGDELLKLVAQRLGETMQPSSGLARIGSDCFAVTIPDVKEEADIAHMVEQRILNSFLQPLTVTGVELRTPAKLGIALFPNDGPDADTLIMNAEAALKKAKVSGEKYLFYAPQMHARIAERLTLENKLRRALEEAQFVLHYQPKVDLKSGRITGLEALIRWQSPERGLVPPGTFIPVLEETGLILDVGRWVMEQAAADYWALLVKGLQPPRIAVNVSALQLRQKGFVDELAHALEKGDRGGDLDLEVTESLIMEDVEGTIAKLEKVRDMGVSVAIDDFGTGFSSLSYLVRLPIDCLKIDRAFIVDMTNSAENLAIVSAVISLAHSLNLRVVAEGVETEAQANLLRLLKCDEMQGYFFSRPIPLPQIEAMLRDASSQ